MVNSMTHAAYFGFAVFSLLLFGAVVAGAQGQPLSVGPVSAAPGSAASGTLTVPAAPGDQGTTIPITVINGARPGPVLALVAGVHGMEYPPILALQRLRTTIEAMQTFSERFGPYRHKTLSAVQGDFNDGMEFSGLYFISRDYFNLYDGTPKNYLVTIAAHETAHQWWFDAVANDQALEPWLDEALATYSEHIYYETIYPELVDWWWGYRYFEFLEAGYVDTTIYDGGGQRPYWDKVYLTGARFFQELRERVGDEIFFAFLKDYYSQYAGTRATAVDFFRLFRAHSAADISDLMTKYFQKMY